MYIILTESYKVKENYDGKFHRQKIKSSIKYSKFSHNKNKTIEKFLLILLLNMITFLKETYLSSTRLFVVINNKVVNSFHFRFT